MKFSKGEIICPKDLDYPGGALVCDGYDEVGRLLAHPLGGGFQLTVPVEEMARFRAVAEAKTGAALFHRGRFCLADSEAALHGWSNGELWNGWAMPRFERAEGERLLAGFRGQGSPISRVDSSGIVHYWHRLARTALLTFLLTVP